MEICEGIHQLKIVFHVTPDIQRYVYVYIITGEYCYLIDTGVDGSIHLIEDYLNHIGYHLQDIKAIFLTHAHPDHIGSAGVIQAKIGCQIYASMKEKEWIEDIDKQFHERPIPNFYNLLKVSANVDIAIEGEMSLQLEKDRTLDILLTPGHSDGSLSFIVNKHILMCGDAIPVKGDIPIYTDVTQCLLSLETFKQLQSIDYYCPAWDDVYSAEIGKRKIAEAKQLINEIGECVLEIITQEMNIDDQTLFQNVCDRMKMHSFKQNPLFLRTILAYRKSELYFRKYEK